MPLCMQQYYTTGQGLDALGGLYKHSLSKTLDIEIERRHPYNSSLLLYKTLSDTLPTPFCGLAHRSLQKFMEMWYERPIYLHNLPIDEQVENVRMKYGYECCSIELYDRTKYVWKGGDDWHH